MANPSVTMEVRIEVNDPDPLVDDEIEIKVSGLQNGHMITVSAEVTERKQVFVSSGHFVAEANGEVIMSTAQSQGGTYTGVSSMGLFWSMQSAPAMERGQRIMKFNGSQPLMFTLRVYNGHVTLEDMYKSSGGAQLMSSVKIRRWYMAKGVQKIPVKAGRVQGTLYLPKGRGPFPGVVDMFGASGSLYEFRSAMFASRGFASLALAYFLHPGMPKKKADVQFEYFEEAVEWLSSHPMVAPGGVGTIGVSMGGEISLHMGHYIPKVKASVSINGCPFFTESPIKYKGDAMGGVYFDLEKLEQTDEGLYVKHIWTCPPDKYLPIWKTDSHYLLIAGEDDMSVDYKVLQTVHDMYPASRRHLCQLEVYPGGGHLIEPPYMPLYRSTFLYDRATKTKYYTLWGGMTVEHAHAQEDSWRKILDFFRKHLPSAPSDSDRSKL